MHTTIYTDGACIGNPGPGGYAAVILSPQDRRELSGGYSLTTNNRMEMMAAIEALETLKSGPAIKLYTDSKYLANGIERGWARKWRAKAWKKGKDKRTNWDLWERLLNFCDQHKVDFIWVRGHAGHTENERCDVLSMQAAQINDLPEDVGYIQRFNASFVRSMRRHRRLASLLVAVVLVGCRDRHESTAAPRTEPEARNLPPTATERFHLQSECVEMGNNVLQNNLAYQMEKLDMEQGKVPKDDVTQLAHYNAKDNHCYVELSLHDTAEHMKYAMREVYDGQTGELLASYTIKNPPLGERSGIIFKYDRVPESALPTRLDFNRQHSDKERGDNDAERTQAYIDYLMDEH